MKPSIFIFCIFVFALLSGCSQKDAAEKSADPAAAQKEYNPQFKKILKAHGGIENWNKQQTLSFTMGDQKQNIDLHSRVIKITSPRMSMGNDGTVWIKQYTAAFQGSPPSITA